MSAFHSAQKYRPGIIKPGLANDGNPMFAAFTITLADEADADLATQIDAARGADASEIREVRVFAAQRGWHLLSSDAVDGFGVPVGSGPQPGAGTEGTQPPLVLHFGPGGVPMNHVFFKNDSGGSGVLSVLALT